MPRSRAAAAAGVAALACAAALLVTASRVPARADSLETLRIGTHGPESGVRLDCKACHGMHAGARRGNGIGTHSRSAACLACHGASGALAASGDAEDAVLASAARAASLVEAVFRKVSHHPLDTDASAARRPQRASLPRLPEDIEGRAAPGGMGCTDCHDPHARSGPALGPVASAMPGSLLTGDGAIVPDSAFCYGCHGTARTGRVVRLLGKDVESLLVAGNPSAHPIEGAATPRGIPGLLPGAGSRRMACADCHGNDDEAGLRGPHGSSHAPLLLRAYEREDGRPESPVAFALCYGCHDRDVLLGETSLFPLHRLHVVESRTSCSTCHDAHGSLENPHLLRFDPAIVTVGTLGTVKYEASVTGRGGSCTLACHAHDHAPSSY